MTKFIPALVLTAFAAFALPAMATQQTINLGTVATGNIPDGTAPWLTATYDWTSGSNTVTLDLTSNLGGSDFVFKTPGWAFWLDPTDSLMKVTCDSTNISGGCTNAGSAIGSFTASPPWLGKYNLLFSWTSANLFTNGSTASYTLTFDSGLTADPFGSNNVGLLSYAHVQGITGGCSGKIVAIGPNGSSSEGKFGGTACIEPPTNVPEPGALGMFGLGIGVIGLFLGLRRRRFR